MDKTNNRKQLLTLETLKIIDKIKTSKIEISVEAVKEQRPVINEEFKINPRQIERAATGLI